MKDYRKLVVWEKAHKVVLYIYGVTKAFPSEERYGLTSQLGVLLYQHRPISRRVVEDKLKEILPTIFKMHLLQCRKFNTCLSCRLN
jgi:hypothetical protein